MSFAETVSTSEPRTNAIAAQNRPKKELFTGGCMKPNLSDRYWLVEKFFGDQGSAFGVHAGAQRRKKCVPLFPLRRGETWYVFSGPIVLVLVLVLRSRPFSGDPSEPSAACFLRSSP